MMMTMTTNRSCMDCLNKKWVIVFQRVRKRSSLLFVFVMVRHSFYVFSPRSLWHLSPMEEHKSNDFNESEAEVIKRINQWLHMKVHIHAETLHDVENIWCKKNNWKYCAATNEIVLGQGFSAETSHLKWAECNLHTRIRIRKKRTSSLWSDRIDFGNDVQIIDSIFGTTLSFNIFVC